MKSCLNKGPGMIPKRTARKFREGCLGTSQPSTPLSPTGCGRVGALGIRHPLPPHLITISGDHHSWAPIRGMQACFGMSPGTEECDRVSHSYNCPRLCVWDWVRHCLGASKGAHACPSLKQPWYLRTPYSLSLICLSCNCPPLCASQWVRHCLRGSGSCDAGGGWEGPTHFPDPGHSGTPVLARAQ